MITRRGLLAGILAAGAAPAIVRAGSIMPIWVPKAQIISLSGDFTLEVVTDKRLVVTQGNQMRWEDKPEGGWIRFVIQRDSGGLFRGGTACSVPAPS